MKKAGGKEGLSSSSHHGGDTLPLDCDAEEAYSPSQFTAVLLPRLWRAFQLKAEVVQVNDLQVAHSAPIVGFDSRVVLPIDFFRRKRDDGLLALRQSGLDARSGTSPRQFVGACWNRRRVSGCQKREQQT